MFITLLSIAAFVCLIVSVWNIGNVKIASGIGSISCAIYIMLSLVSGMDSASDWNLLVANVAILSVHLNNLRKAGLLHRWTVESIESGNKWLDKLFY